MRHFLKPFLCLLSALLAGCLSAPPAAEAESGPIPELTMLGSAELFSLTVMFFALSEDGSTFIAGSPSSVGLYRASDYMPLERYYIPEKEPSTPADDADTGRTAGHVVSFFLKTRVCDKLAKATGAAREIKALRFSKMVLEILFSIAYHFNEFR